MFRFRSYSVAIKDEISSTEKLLDLIRKKNAGQSQGPPLSTDLKDLLSSEPAKAAKENDNQGKKTGKFNKFIKLKRKEKPAVDPLLAIISNKPPLRERFFRKLASIFAIKKEVTLSVNIGFSEVRIARIIMQSGRRYLLEDMVSIPIDRQLEKNTPKFFLFLRSTLKQYIDDKKKVMLWSAIPPSGLEIRHFKIPKVPPRELRNAVYWTYKKIGPFEESDVVFDFMIIGEVYEEGTNKFEIVAYTAPESEILKVKALFAKCGFPLTGLSTAPFAIQNLFISKWFDTLSTNVCCIFIGRDWSRIDIFSNGYLILTRGIRSGMNLLAETIKESLNQRYSVNEGPAVGEAGGLSAILVGDETPDDDSLELETKSEEERIEAPPPEKVERFSMNNAMDILFSLLEYDVASAKKKFNIEISEDEIFNIILPSLNRFIRQIERTFEHFALSTKGERVVKIYATGLEASYERLLRHIEKELDISVDIIDPFSPLARLSVHIKKTVRIPDSVGDRVSYAPLLGLAVANEKYAPNLIKTYDDKLFEKNIAFIKKGMITFFMIFVLALGCFSLWQDMDYSNKKRALLAVETQLNNYRPRIDRNHIVKTLVNIKNNRKKLQLYAEKYQGVAMVNELISMTPDNVSLISLKMNLIPKNSNKEEVSSREFEIEGIVTGERSDLNSDLASYLADIKRSRLFETPDIIDKNDDMIDGARVLHFFASVKMAYTPESMKEKETDKKK